MEAFYHNTKVINGAISCTLLRRGFQREKEGRKGGREG